MSEMQTLIDRLTAATGPDRELDALIHRAVTPGLADTLTTADSRVIAPGWCAGGDHEQPTQAPHYTASLDAAMTLVPPECDSIRFVSDPSGSGWELGQFLSDLNYKERGAGVTGGLFAIALCIAALRARAAAEKRDE